MRYSVLYSSLMTIARLDCAYSPSPPPPVSTLPQVLAATGFLQLSRLARTSHAQLLRLSADSQKLLATIRANESVAYATERVWHPTG